MRHLTIAALAAGFITLLAGPAEAQLMIKRSCAGRSCVTTLGYYDPNGGLGKVIHVPQKQDAEQDARIVKWEEFCEPKIVLDKSGVRRYVYSKPGCEFGRAE